MALEARGLRMAYRRREVVKGVDFAVERGEVVGLLGPNGAGKTTSFYMVLGLLRPDAGSILMDGDDVTGLPMHLRCRRGLAYLAQEPSVFRRLTSVFRRLTVRDNLLPILEMEPMAPTRRLERAEELQR